MAALWREWHLSRLLRRWIVRTFWGRAGNSSTREASLLGDSLSTGVCRKRGPESQVTSVPGKGCLVQAMALLHC